MEIKGYGQQMGQRYTISQLARAAGVPTTTLRHYERIGLLRPEDRSSGNYRLYGQASLHKLKFIRAAQAIGFTLHDIKALLSTPGSTASTCREVQSLIEDRLAEVERRLRDLRHVQRVLRASLQKCKNTEKADRCHVVDALQEMSMAK